MASHSILRAQVWKRSGSSGMCRHHEDSKVWYVCLHSPCQEELACMKCVTTNHQGHRMEDLEVFATKQKQLLKDKLKTDRSGILETLLQKIQYTEGEITANKKKIDNEKEKIFKQCNDMKNKLDGICKKYVDMCHKTEIENDTKLTQHKECLQSLYNNYKTELEELEGTLENGSDFDIVITARNLPTPQDLPNTPSKEVLHFKLKETSDGYLEKLFENLLFVKESAHTKPAVTEDDSSGQPVSTSKAVQVLEQFLSQRNTKYHCRYLYPLLREVYIWFYGSDTVLLVNSEGMVTNKVILQTMCDKNESLVCVCASPVDNCFWSVTNTGRFNKVRLDGTQVESFEHESVISICVTGSKSLVIGVRTHGRVNDHKIKILNQSEVIKTVSIADVGLKFRPHYITQCPKTRHLAVTDYNFVSVLDENLEHLHTIKGSNIPTVNENFYPTRMCFNKEGNLLVIDDNNFNVIMFSSSGQYLRTIVQQNHDDICPCAVNTAPDGTLWVAYVNDIVNKIKY